MIGLGNKVSAFTAYLTVVFADFFERPRPDLSTAMIKMSSRTAFVKRPVSLLLQHS